MSAGQSLADEIDRAIYRLQQVGATAQLMADGAYHRLGAFDPLPNALDHLNDCIQGELAGLRNAHDAFEASTKSDRPARGPRLVANGPEEPPDGGG